MRLSPDFHFSQGSLQDFADCPRRFRLRYLQRLAWPAVEAEPALENERLMRQGALFHHVIQQNLLGVPAERLNASVQGGELARWWQNFRAGAPALWGGGERPPQGAWRAEVELTAKLSDYRLIAKYDLILIEPGGRALIVDWKTSRRKPKRQTLAERLQTRAYPYLLVEAGSWLNGGRPLWPENVEMVYWFADFPGEPERFAYSAAQRQKDGEYLAGLVAEILRLPEEGDLRTPRVERCRFCVYRSLCERGVRAGPLDEIEDAAEAGEGFDFQLDFEQIAEIKL